MAATGRSALYTDVVVHHIGKPTPTNTDVTIKADRERLVFCLLASAIPLPTYGRVSSRER